MFIFSHSLTWTNTLTNQNQIKNNIPKVLSTDADYSQKQPSNDFHFKARIPRELRSGVIFELQCRLCKCRFFLFNIRNYSLQIRNITLARVNNFGIEQKKHEIFVLLYTPSTKAMNVYEWIFFLQSNEYFSNNIAIFFLTKIFN